jgi:hypothetical protein
MSRSPWLMLSLVMPAALGAVTVVTLSHAPARTTEPSLFRSSESAESEARESQSNHEEQGDDRAAPGASPPSQAAPASEKSLPMSKPRVNEPAEASGPVLFA